MPAAFHPTVPDFLQGDPGRLRQILVNLIGNAIKFTTQGEVVLSVQMQNAECGMQNEKKDDDSSIQHSEFCILHFQVRDTGIGISPDKQRLIFEPFSQADSSTTRRFGGTGLGLAISSQLVSMMHGRIWLESQPGTGSTFHFTACLGVLDEVGLPPGPESVKDVAVLIVDDNRTNRRILEELLTSWGMRPASADSGPAALAELQRAANAGTPYPLVLLDFLMPDMDGLTLAEHIRQDEQLNPCALLLLSSAGNPADAGACKRLGIARCLTKPVKQKDLLDAILMTLGQTVRADRAPCGSKRGTTRKLVRAAYSSPRMASSIRRWRFGCLSCANIA